MPCMEPSTIHGQPRPPGAEKGLEVSLLMSLLLSKQPKVRMLQPTSGAFYTVKQKESVCLWEAQSLMESREVGSGCPGQENPRIPRWPLCTHNTSGVLSQRTNDSVCGGNRGVHQMQERLPLRARRKDGKGRAGSGARPPLLILSTVFTPMGRYSWDKRNILIFR